MDNGVGVVDEAPLIHPVDGALETKLEGDVPSGLPAPREPEGDEVFEEAVDDNLDDDVHSIKGDSNDAVVSVSSVVLAVGGINVSGVDGVEFEEHEDEVMLDARTLSDGFVSDDNEEILLEGNDDHRISVATLDDKGGTENEGIQADEDRAIGNVEGGNQPQVGADDEHEETVEPEHHSVVEMGTLGLNDDENVDDEPIQELLQVLEAEEKLEEGDAEEMKHNGADALEVITSDEAVAFQNVNEMNTELLSEALARMSSVDLNDVNDIAGDGLTGEGEDSGSLPPTVAMPATDAHLKNGSGSTDVSDKIELQHDANGEIEHVPTSPFEQEEGSNSVEGEIVDSEIEASSASDSSSLLKNKEYEAIASNSERQHASIDQAELNPGNISNSSTLAEVGVKAREAAGEKEKQSSQESATAETKPVASAVAATEKSANPVLPSVRPAGLGRSAPAGLGRSAPLLEPAPRVVQQPRSNGAVSQAEPQLVEEVGNGEVEEADETREKLQMIRVKFLRLAHRLGQTPHNVVVAQVLYRLGLAEQLRGRTGGRTGAFSYDRASAMAEQLEQTGREPLDFACTIMVLGKTGVGKSATINSIFDEVKFNTDAFDLGTKKVQEVEGTVQGIKVRIIDTPGLFPSWSEQLKNEKILNSVKQFIKKSPPDIILYLDRLDMPSRDFSDMPLLRSVTDVFGPSIWFNAIVVLTHAASAPPEGPNGTASTYDMFVTQRSHAIQQAIRQAAGDMRLMNPVSLVENHSACRTNRAGQRVLPNGQVWKPHLLLLSFASKILAEANTLLKLQDTPPGKPFAARSRAPPLPFLLSSLLQSRPQLKLPDQQFGEDDGFDDDLDDSSDSDEESEYDELPPFRRLTNAQLAKLDKEQKKAYYDELEYRERLYMKKQLKEERKRRKMMKKMAESAKDMPVNNEENAEEDESGSAASVPVPMPDLALPASFDADNPTHRYRHLDTNQWLVRPVLDAHGWDHDVGYEGINVERLLVVKDKIPVSFSGQVSKDKREASLQMEVASSIKHGEGKGTTLGFDMQSIGKDMAYTLRSETLFSNYKRNKATAGLSFTLLGDVMTAGLKLEDKLVVNKQLRMVMSGGAMAGRGDTAYGGSLEATLRDKDPLGRFLSSLGLSVMDWHGDLAIGCNIQSQIPVGRSTTLIARANLNHRGSGQVSLRLNSSEQIQLALIGLIPLLRKVVAQYSTSQQL